MSEAVGSTSGTLERILEVAETEFARSGYDGAHLQEIAGQVGVQKTALYYYFASKSALYERVLIDMLTAFEATIAGALERDAGPEERLVVLVDALNDLLASRPTYARILIRVFVDRTHLPGDEIGPLLERITLRLLRFFRAGMDAGVFRKASPRHLFQSCIGALVFHYGSGRARRAGARRRRRLRQRRRALAQGRVPPVRATGHPGRSGRRGLSRRRGPARALAAADR